MKRTIVVALALSLVAGAMTAPAMAKKKKPKKPVRVERVVEMRYEAPSAVGTGDAGGVCSGCPAIPNTSDEVWMKVEVIDDALPIGGVDISFGDSNGDGFFDGGFFVCGATDGWVEVPGASAMQTFPYIVSGSQCPGGGATSGTIKVTYSNMPPPGE